MKVTQRILRLGDWGAAVPRSYRMGAGRQDAGATRGGDQLVERAEIEFGG